ncbi:ribulose-phosphate 3-epimerase [Candidatus Woesearchaeota archaeon]|nr:ribulose-phosphate 3-epimerase [Candidatus Woesearchaeota archaeon]
MIIITASLMCASQLYLYRDVRSLLNAGIDMFHFDIMDGDFVENIALNIDLIKELRSVTHKKFDAHLMVRRPSKFISRLKDAGVNIIYFHIEAAEDPHYVIELIKREGLEAGLVINPETSLERIYPYIGQIDYLMFMTVQPGFAGQKFEHAVLHKIDQLREFRCGKNDSLKLVADGAINEKTLPQLAERGVHVFVGGSAGLFNQEGFNNNLEILKQRDLMVTSLEKK